MALNAAFVKAMWVVALASAVLWPSHTLSALHGIPLDTRAGALVIGLAVPVLCWIDRRYLDTAFARIAIVALVALKIADATLLTQQGLCARFSTSAPYTTNVLTIPIEEPRGILRSWDVRADWRADVPACTAIVDRPWPDASSFPAWFVNITDFATSGRRNLTMDVSGYVRAGERGLFVLDVDRDMTVGGRIASQDVSSTGGRPVLAALEAGPQPVDLHAALTGDRWRLVPTLNGHDAFSTASITIAKPRAIDRLAGAFSLAETALVVLLVGGWVVSIGFE